MAKKKATGLDRSKELIATAKRKKGAEDGLPCVLFTKGADKGAVLIGPRGRALPQSDIREQRRSFSGGAMYLGVCYGINNGIAFDLFGNPDSDTLPPEPKFKKMVNDCLDTSYKTVQAAIIPMNQMGELANDFGDFGAEVAGDDAPAATEQASTSASESESRIPALTERFKGMQEQLKRVLADNPKHQATLKKAAAAVVGQLKKGEPAADNASKAIETLAKALDKLDSTGSPASDAKATAGAIDLKALEVALQTWRTASETVDSQLSRLQEVLLATDDEELVEIAEFGLNAVTGDFKVPLMTALMNLDRAAEKDKAKLATAVLTAAAEFKTHIARSEQVAVCDDNPFGVQVSIAATLGPALDQFEKALGG